MMAPQFELQQSPSEKAVIYAACAAKPDFVTVTEGENSLYPLHDINLFPDVSAVAAHLVNVPISSTGAPDAVQIEEEIPALDFSSDSENDSEYCQIRAGT